jgi:hypothetical protein
MKIMKEILRKSKILEFIIAFIVLLVIVQLYMSIEISGTYKQFGSHGLSYFYNINDYGGFIFFIIYVSFFLSNLINDIFYENKYSKFQNLIIARTGHKKRLKYEIKTVLIVSFIFRIILNLLLLLIIHLKYSHIVFKEYSDISYYSDGLVGLFINSKVSLILYLIYSAIGFSIMSLFNYSLINLIKNKYVYRISGVIFPILLTILSALIGNLLYQSFDNIKFANPLLQIFNAMSLLCPGINNFSTITSILEVHIYFWYTLICYTIISLILIYIRYRKERKYG